MNKLINIENVVAKKICNLSYYTVENTVGKSWPALVHEVKMPESIKKEFMNENMNDAQ